ncbi:MAG: peptidylprolyl isomerase [Kofleriaceae bacterium]
MRTRFAALFFALPLIAAAVAPAQAQPADAAAAPKRRAFLVDRVVAVVNDAIVLDSELAVQLMPYEDDLAGIDDAKERARRRDKLRAQVLDEMIAEQLMIEAAAAANLEPVGAKEVDQVIRETKEEHKLDDAAFQQALAAQGYTLGQYRTNITRQLTRLRAMKMLVAPKVNVSDEEVRAQYDQMARRSDAVSQVRLAHIQLALPERPTEAEVSAARAKAADIVTRARAGEDFGKLAAEFSDDANTKTSGGELGWIERGTLEPAWETVVFAMEPKEVRGPVAGPRGLEVFYVAENKRTEMKTFEQLKDQLRGELQQRGMQKATEAWIAELRKKAYVEVKL